MVTIRKHYIDNLRCLAFDYYEELLPELSYVKEDSFLEELDEQNLGIRIRETLASSIAYTFLCR